MTRAERRTIKAPRKLKEGYVLKVDEVADDRLVPHQVIQDMTRMGKAPSADKLIQWGKMAREQYPTIAGFNDPLAAFIVVREICRLVPGQQISAEKLGYILAANAPQFVWTTQTIGRLLGGLADFSKETARQQDRQELPYVERVRLGAGPVYVVWDAPQTYIFLHAVLDALAIEAEKAIARVYTGSKIATRDSIWLEIEPNLEAL